MIFMTGFRTIQCASYCFLHIVTSNSSTGSSLFVRQDGGGQEARFGGKKRQNNGVKLQANVSFAFHNIVLTPKQAKLEISIFE